MVMKRIRNIDWQMVSNKLTELAIGCSRIILLMSLIWGIIFSLGLLLVLGMTIISKI